METYVVRIYRRNSEKSDCVVGVAEEIETGQTKKFNTLSELLSIFRGKEDKGNVQHQMNQPD